MKEPASRALLLYQVIIFTTLFVGYAIYNYNRKCVSFALPRLIEQGSLDKSSVGIIVSSQNMAYAISKFLGGVLSDKISSRALFTTGLVLSGLSAVTFSYFNSIWMFSFLWFVNGFAQGAGWPACAKLLRHWFSPLQFGTWWSVLSTSINVSGALSPLIAAYLLTNYGWRVSVFVAGLVTIGMSIVACVGLIDSPTMVGLPTFAVPPRKTSISNTADTKMVLSSPFIWILCFCYMSVFAVKTSAIDWGQMYLMDDRNQSQYIASTFTSFVEFGGFFGGILAGTLADRAVKLRSKAKTLPDAKPQPHNPRMPIATAFMVLVTVSLYLLINYVHAESSSLTISLIAFILGASCYGPIAIFGIVANEAAPVALSGTAHAIVALAANMGAIISGYPFSLIASVYSWSAIFQLLQVISASAVVLMLISKNTVTAHIIKSKYFWFVYYRFALLLSLRLLRVHFSQTVTLLVTLEFPKWMHHLSFGVLMEEKSLLKFRTSIDNAGCINCMSQSSNCACVCKKK